MRAETCPTCGGAADPTGVCPRCGAVPGSVATALADIEREIAELAARDVRIQTERTELSQRMQAAMHRRALLANAQDLRQRHSVAQRGGVRRRRALPPPRYGDHAGARPTPDAPDPTPDAPDPTPRAPSRAVGAGAAPRPVGAAAPAGAEASTRSVQTVLLLLGALLLGVSATVFAGVALTAVSGLARAAVLAAAAVLTLGVPPRLAARGLVATAETVAAVGLLLVPLVGSALWGVPALRPPVSGHAYAALVCAVTAAVAAWYAGATGLAAPRYATLLAVQPVLPLAAYPHVRADAAWALVFAAVALLDLVLARALPTRLARWAQVRRPRPGPPPRPESAAEEPDAAVGGSGTRQPGPGTGPPGAVPPGPREAPARPAQAALLARLSWVLHLAAACLGLAFGVAALSAAQTAGAGVAGWLATVAVAAVAVAAARRPDLAALAQGLLALALVGGGARVATLTWPAPAPVAAAVVVAVAAALLHALPRDRRRGPRAGIAVVLAAVLTVVAGGALGTAADALAAVRPAWHADLTGYDVTAPQGPALLLAALVAGAATALLAAPGWRREWTAVPLVLAALAAPGALALPWLAAPWPAAGVAVALAALAVASPRGRAAHALVTGAGFAAAFAAGTSLARPDLTAAVLGTLGCAGVLVLLARRPLRRSRTPLAGALRRAAPGAATDWVAAGTLLAVAGAVAAVLAGGGASHPARLTGTALVVCAGLLAGAFAQVRRRTVSVPLAVAGVLGGLGITVGALRLADAGLVDAALGVLLVAAALSMPLAPAVDARRRSDHRHDGADMAAAAAVAATVATLARAAALAVPAAPLLTAAVCVTVLAVTTRVLPKGWRRGPVLGLAVAGGVLVLWVAVATLRDGLRAVAAPGPVWHGDLSGLPAAGPHDWQVPLAALVLALAAAAALPRPARYDVAAALVGLATIAAPAAFGLPWWSPIVIDGIVAAAYAVAAVTVTDPRAGLARAVVGAAVALHAVAAGLVRPWTTAAALALLAVLGAIVATAARRDPRRRSLAGGGAAVALLTAPGAVACTAASLRLPAHAALTLGMAAAVAGLLAAAALRRAAPHLLPYASAGIAGGATAVAVAALPSGRVALYAAGAVLLGVLAEVLRHRTPPPDPGDGAGRRWRVPPARGAVAAAALPGLLAVGVLTPPLWAALTAPGATWRRAWHGPPPALVALSERPDVTPAAVLAAALLTVAAAAAVRGLTDRHTAEAIPVLLPGLGLTLLIAPLGLHLPWPAVTLAALLTFVVLLLGVALVPPPPVDGATPVVAGRVAAVALGLAAGAAGLAGSLATKPLTLATLGGAVLVGAVAGYAGRTPAARTLGWLFGAVAAQALALTAGLAAGWPVHWSAFGVLATGAALLIAAATLPRFGRTDARGEARAVEWSAYAAAVLAAVLAARSSPHLAAVLAGWGAVLGLAAGRRGRPEQEQRTLFWLAIGCEVAAWWLLMWVADVPTVEVYTLPFAAVALAVGVWEERRRPELSSWLAYGPALVAAFVPTLVVVVTGSSPLRQVLLLLAAVATLIVGSARRKQAPVVVGAVVTTLVALHALVQFGPWLVLLPVGVLLLWFGADNEKRRRDVRRLRGAVRTMT
ncbi:MAG TPA: permease [Pilimelia sp.]|nr:permease [Pilimelia sp.]